ncbi:hypoxia induced protein conserved region-domain containing protein [Nitzschia inconspicua]|uniref:Hypoxia induced protein conserved region-domain containing protein n=1 Tax=Nitzschia inconspicua TaxID=303405 RepID=A0A9K3LDI2_9STRA|nr:hypoxia induced protein conserved region-domain containing protein [Nitzschia inconspicua]
MGSSVSRNMSVRSACENNVPPTTFDPSKIDNNSSPPEMHRPLSFEEKVWQKFKKEPLVPIGCVATAYFLASGIKSFQNQDPRRGQKMMRARVAAQFATLGMFMYYLGVDRINFEIAPQYQRARKARQEAEQAEQAEK